MRWSEYALCRDYDPEMFFPIALEGTLIGNLQRVQAKRVCGACPVQRRCLNHALTAPEKYGVWGGATETERSLLSSATQVS